MSDVEYDSDTTSSSDNEEIPETYKSSVPTKLLNKDEYVDEGEGLNVDDSDVDPDIDDESDMDEEEPEELDDDPLKGGGIEDEDEYDDIDGEEDSENENEGVELNDNNEVISKKGKGVLSVSGNKNVKQKKIINFDIESDEEDEDDDDDDNYLQKFDSDIKKNYINEFHPECYAHNYQEIADMCKVVRDSNNIIIDPLHKTIPFLTKYEKARILGQRAKQIEFGSKPFVKVTENVIDSYVIAELELQQKRIPFIIKRPLSNGGCEYWNLKDLEIICF